MLSLTTTAMPETQPTFLSRALDDGHARLTGEGKTERIHYIAAGHSERYSDPEEKVLLHGIVWVAGE